MSAGSYEPISQAVAPPNFHESPFHVSLPGSPGPGTVQNRQTSLPVSWSRALRYPRAPYSPPPNPVITRFFTMVGGEVMTDPWVKSTTCVFHSSWPVLASSATMCPSSRPTKILPLACATPRLLTSQHANWSMPPGTSGEYRHRTEPVLASTANTFLGPNEDVTYSVSPTRIGVDSCERTEPSCSAHATRSCCTLPVLILARLL